MGCSTQVPLLDWLRNRFGSSLKPLKPGKGLNLFGLVQTKLVKPNPNRFWFPCEDMNASEWMFVCVSLHRGNQKTYLFITHKKKTRKAKNFTYTLVASISILLLAFFPSIALLSLAFIVKLLVDPSTDDSLIEGILPSPWPLRVIYIQTKFYFTVNQSSLHWIAYLFNPYNHGLLISCSRIRV